LPNEYGGKMGPNPKDEAPFPYGGRKIDDKAKG